MSGRQHVAASRRSFLGALGAGAAAAPAAVLGSALPASSSGAPSAPGRPVRTGTGRRRPRVQTGADRLAADGFAALAGQRVGVITNPTGVLADLRHEVDVMAASGAVDLRAVLGPEHGFRGAAQAGESEDTSVDERTGVTVYDAYGAGADDFARLYDEADVETVVFDIQDVGARFYTYVWTMYDAMVAAATTGRRFLVLDRPNPVGGDARGPMMTDEFRTFVGNQRIAQQHGMTVGELAAFLDGELITEETGGARLGDRLEVVPIRGWRGSLPWQDTGLPWVPPSPNVPTPDVALAYTGTCWFEGTLMSEGRGTTTPFQTVGSPGADWRWAEAVAGYDLDGLAVREASFTPTFSKHAGEVCHGLQLHVTDPVGGVDAITAATAMLVEARRLVDGFAWREDAYDPARPFWVDKLSGSSRLREMVDAGASVAEVTAAWAPELAAFEAQRRPYLRYPRGLS
ncbi:DUF1343 domain-containing protein [uncultured Pseudokineococcus sp.]|uniref:exo-beta-N-acetylmuramidase NamZ family protein n=1 Tax=uncultured Pseudokineococcus sp. TaxID=1642928 RepID=UPI002639BCD6|nr:DUF1343 domain-containing protein [uncultured Pseudokineococcus sp.]